MVRTAPSRLLASTTPAPSCTRCCSCTTLARQSSLLSVLQCVSLDSGVCDLLWPAAAVEACWPACSDDALWKLIHSTLGPQYLSRRAVESGKQLCFGALPQVEMALMLETDPSEILNEIIYATRKGGNIGIGALCCLRMPL